MYEVIRHGQRNMEPCDYSDCDGKHPGRYDGSMLSHAPEDIHWLIEQVKKLQAEMKGSGIKWFKQTSYSDGDDSCISETDILFHFCHMHM